MHETFEVFVENTENTRVIAYKNVNGHDLKPGDMYIAKRNTGWQLGIVRRVNHEEGWVMSDPPCSLYSYNCNECYKVKEIYYESPEIVAVID